MTRSSGIVALGRWGRDVAERYRGFDGLWWPTAAGVAPPDLGPDGGLLALDAVAAAAPYLRAAIAAEHDVVHVSPVEQRGGGWISDPDPGDGWRSIGYDVGTCSVGEWHRSVYSLIAHAIWRHPGLAELDARRNEHGLFASPELAWRCHEAHARLPAESVEDLTGRAVRVFAIHAPVGPSVFERTGIR